EQVPRDLVVKLYKPAAESRADVVRDQFESMARLHARLSGSTINGWTIHAPLPLYRCERPFALVMTLVPGKPLNCCLETAGLVDSDRLDSLAETVVAVMERWWSIDTRAHGDFNFDNILCDPDTRSL